MGLFSQKESQPIETQVVDATSETLTGEDWSKIIVVCDEISRKPTQTAPVAIETLRGRLSMPNGNIQLYSLTLLNAIAQNCGQIPQREIASTATANVLQRLGASPATHRTVLARLLSVLKSMSETFANDPTLAQIGLVYDRLQKMHPHLASSLGPPTGSSSGKPAAGAKTSQTKPEDEDEDLKRAIELSIQESQAPTPAAEIARHVEQASPMPRTYVKGLYDFSATEDGELSFKTGDVIEVTDRVYKEWWKGLLGGREGIFPVNYVEPYRPADSQSVPSASDPQPAPSAASLSNPAVIDESYLFAQVPAVEKLLTILASAAQDGTGSSVISNPDVQQLYHQISSMRPRLVQVIDEYALKKEELVKMNQMLLTARRTYEKLVSEAASGHLRRPSQPQYGHPVQPQYSGPAPNGQALNGQPPNNQAPNTQLPNNQAPTGQLPNNQLHNNQLHNNQLHNNQLHNNQTLNNQLPNGQPAYQPPPTPSGHQYPSHPEPIQPQYTSPPANSYAPTPLQPQYTHPVSNPIQPQYTASHFSSPQPAPANYNSTPYAPYAPAPYASSYANTYPAPGTAPAPAKLPYPDDKQTAYSGTVAPGAPRPY